MNRVEFDSSRHEIGFAIAVQRIPYGAFRYSIVVMVLRWTLTIGLLRRMTKQRRSIR